MTLAYVFPGQGSQEVGMGKVFYDNFAVARQVYEEVDETLKQKLSQLIFAGDAETLTLTENAQPAIMATSIAMFRVLENEGGFSLKDKASYVAGHSLGEYSALCAAGALSLADTAHLLKLRGKAMQEAAPKGFGTMAAILGLELPEVEAILAGISQGKVEIANDNAPGQIVISGEKHAVEQAMQLAKEKGAKRALELNVSAPFHSSLICTAADAMQEALKYVTIYVPAVPLVANVTASEIVVPATIRELLVKQVTSRVRWTESVRYMVAHGVTEMLEIGHGKVLSGLVKRIAPDVKCANISSPDDVETLLKVA